MSDPTEEEAAGLGAQWPYDAPMDDRVALSAVVARETGLSVGDPFILRIDLRTYFGTLWDRTWKAQTAMENEEREREREREGEGEGEGGAAADEYYYWVDNSTIVLGGGGDGDGTGEGEGEGGGNATPTNEWYFPRGAHIAYLRLVVGAVADGPAGKWPADAERVVLLDIRHAAAHLSTSLHPVVSRPLSRTLFDIQQWAPTLIVNMSPDRTAAYAVGVYDAVQVAVTSFASQVAYVLGFHIVYTYLPVLSSLRGTRFFSLFLGMIVNVIIVVLLFLALLCLTALLTISVDTRVREGGILRMLGLRSRGLGALLIVQALSYAVPALAVGFLAGQAGLSALSSWFSGVASVPIAALLTAEAVGVTFLLGLVGPLVAAAGPARAAAGRSLAESIDSQRSRSSAVKVTVSRADDGRTRWALVASGAMLAAFGAGVYYVMPLALLSNNFALLLNLFVFLLVALLFGLVLLALNIEYFLEIGVLRLLIAPWERPHVVAVIGHNLRGHRPRNRKTAILFATSIAFVVFISTAYRMQAATIAMSAEKNEGVRLSVRHAGVDLRAGPLQLNRVLPYLEYVARQHPLIRGSSVESFPLAAMGERTRRVEVESVGGYRDENAILTGVDPQFFRTVNSDRYLAVGAMTKDVAVYADAWLATALYSPWGMHSVGFGSAVADKLAAQVGDDVHLKVELDDGSTVNSAFLYRRARSCLHLDSSAGLAVSAFPSGYSPSLITSLHTMRYLAAVAEDTTPGSPAPSPEFADGGGRFSSILEVPLSRFLVDVDPAATDADLDEIRALLTVVQFSGSLLTVWDIRDELEPIELANEVMSYFFNVTTAAAMLVSFFSLLASTYANVYEQTKELGVLRALGLSRFALYRLVAGEAFVLVVSASLLGALVGTAVGYTLMLQQTLFTQLPLTFETDPSLLLTMFLVSIFSAVLAAVGPVRAVGSGRNMVSILRFQG
jgi:ABC-type antimicrobial peptide transport system permease subunit